LNTTQLFGHLTPCRILKPLSEYRDDSQKIFLDFINLPIRIDYVVYIYLVWN